MKPHFYDVDDLWDAGQITKYLVPLRRANTNFQITCYAIPAKLGPVHLLRQAFPWITFAQHGWEHTPFECTAWTKDRAKDYIYRARKMGYSNLFKPPNWRYDDELVQAALELDVPLALHIDDPIKVNGLKVLNRYEGVTWAHTHIVKNPATDFIADHLLFQPDYLVKVEEFLSPWEMLNGRR